MENNCKNKKYLREILFMGLLIIVTFYLLFKDNDLGELINVIKSCKANYVAIGIICALVFTCGEALNIRRTLNVLFKYKVSFIASIKYAFVGFFFSAITPSSTGGQPMQVYYMKKDNIEVSHSSLTLLMELTSFQFISIIFAVLSIVINFQVIRSMNSSVIIFLAVGITLNLIVLMFIMCAIFSNNFVVNLLKSIFKVIDKLKFCNIKPSTRESIFNQLSEYKAGVVLMKKNKKIAFKILLTSIIQITASYSITYFVYRALGLNGLSIFHIIGIQSILSSTVSCLPIPGAVGVSESVFLILFKTIYPPVLLGPAMLLSRGINFYFLLIISAIGIIISSKNKFVKKLS